MSKLCKECGHQMDDNVQVCPNCGRPAENVEVKNRTNAFNLPKVLMIVLCVFAVLQILYSIEHIFVFGNYANFNIFESIVVIPYVLILIGALLYNKHKNAYFGMVVGFCIITIMTIFGIVSMMMSYSSGSNEVTENIIDTTRVSVQTEEVTQIKEEELTDEQKEEIANKKVIGTYTFGDGYENWQITINDDGTCTMFEKTTSEYLWHGSWVIDHWDYSYYEVTWSSCDNPLLHLPFTSKYNYIDKEVKYLYAGSNELKAKDPNGRYELRK